MQKDTIWFTTLAGGQLGVHLENIGNVVVHPLTDMIKVEVISEQEEHQVRLCDNIDTMRRLSYQ